MSLVSFDLLMQSLLKYILSGSKNSPDVSTFDKPGKPFTQLLEQTGCSAGPLAVSCLQKVPFEVSIALFGKCK
jgi:hypothetical protein